MLDGGRRENARAIAMADVRSPGTEAMVSSSIRCLAAAIIVAAAHLVSAAQSPSARATDLYDRARELERQGNAAGALSLLWEAAGLAPKDGAIQNDLGRALERIGALDAAVDAYRTAADAPA